MNNSRIERENFIKIIQNKANFKETKKVSFNNKARIFVLL